jgi:hypothetical protein
LELSTKDERTVMVVVRERIVPERGDASFRRTAGCVIGVLKDVVFDVAVDVAIVNDFQSPKRRKIHESARATHD